MPRSNRYILEAISDLASAQRGLVTARQLAELGFAATSLSRRARQGGPWERVLPGTYLVSRPPLTPDQRLQAALLFAGTPALLTGRSALALHGVDLDLPALGDEVHLLIPRERKRTSHRWVHVERTERWPEVRSLDGCPVAPPARAAIDLSRRLSRRRDVEALMTTVLNRGLTDVGALTRELGHAQRRRSALAREVLASMSAGPVSVAELDLFRRWTASGLPQALWNVELVLEDGTFLARPDVYLSDVGVAVEVDSLRHHYSRFDWERTMERHARMTAAGLLVIHVTPGRVLVDWPRIVDEIRSAAASRRGNYVASVRPRHS